MNTIITELHGADFKSWVIALFTVSAGLSRPFAGKLADTIGRKKVMVLGLVVCSVVTVMYPFSTTVLFLLVLRFVHGFSAGFYPTAATALITDVLPEHSRGGAMGVWGTFISLGIGVGQGVCTPIVNQFGQDGLFYVSFILIALSYALLWVTKETLSKPDGFRWDYIKLKSDEIIEPHVFPVAVVMLLSASCSGIIFVLSPDIAEQLKMGNKGSFFIFYVLATILIRLFTGRISDKIGRRQMLIIGMALLCISMIMIGFARTPNQFMLASILFGIATGSSSPTIFAWTADLSPESRRGIGAGTVFIALELGIFAGAGITNLFYDNRAANIPIIFMIGAGAALATMIYLIWHLRYRFSPT